MSIVIKEPANYITEKNHYLIDGKKYWRTTRVKGVIYNYGLVNWQVTLGKEVYTKIMNERADFGTKNHQLFKHILDGYKVNPENYDEETQVNLQLFKDFLCEYEIKPELLEQHLWSNRYGYAGTADFIGYVGGKLMILDWKTSKAIYPDMWLQLAAYAHAYKEITNSVVTGVGILQLRDGKSKFEIKKISDAMDDFDIFKACLTIWKWQKHGK